MNETPRACIKGFRESTDSIRLSLMISEYECPFLLKTSIWIFIILENYWEKYKRLERRKEIMCFCVATSLGNMLSYWKQPKEMGVITWAIISATKTPAVKGYNGPKSPLGRALQTCSPTFHFRVWSIFTHWKSWQALLLTGCNQNFSLITSFH